MTDDREARLDALRHESAARVHAVPRNPIAAAPLPHATPSYYGRPLLKAPVWTWEVPAYLFVGGAAGAAAVIAAAAGFGSVDPALARDARWLAFTGACLSPLLLIADLGRPARFLNMLRVFKRQSAMSIGAWTLVTFSMTVTIAVLWHLTGAAGATPIVAHLLDLAAAALGLVLSTYTGVLLGVTAVPVWARHASRLPMLFAASSLGAAISILELAGHVSGVTNAIGIGAALGELAVVVTIATARDRASLPLRHSRLALMIGMADALSAGVPLILRLTAEHSTPARTAAAVTTVAGSLLLRYGWIAAGRVSTSDPVAALKPGASR